MHMFFRKELIVWDKSSSRTGTEAAQFYELWAVCMSVFAEK